MSTPRSQWWARKDVQRIRQRLTAHGADLAAGERAYLRNWALLLLASELELDEQDLTRLRWLARDLERLAAEERAA